MSKFIDDVKLNWGETRHISDIDWIETLPDKLGIQYGVADSKYTPMLDYVLVCSYTQRGKAYSKDADKIKEAFIAGLKDRFFGDIREIEKRLHVAIYERDMKKIREALDALHKEIY